MRFLSYSHAYYGAGHNAGAETTLHGLMLEVKRAGHEAMALCSRPHKDGSGSYVLDGVKVQAFASKQDPNLYFPQFDGIITQFECAQRASYIAGELGIPTFQVVHNYTEYSTNIALRYNDYLLYNSHHVASTVNNLFPRGREKEFVTVHPVIDPKIYGVETERKYITLVNLSDGQEPFFNKGYEHFYRLAEQFPNEQFLGVQGAYGNQVIRAMPNVTILPHQHNILNVYRQSKIVLMPSEIESYGRVAIEAACSAIPSLTSTAPGFLESGIGYRSIPFGDYGAWTVALRDLLENYNYACYEAKQRAEKIYLSTKAEVGEFITFLEQKTKQRG